jgi:type II secretory pathway pseudopilin PulG
MRPGQSQRGQSLIQLMLVVAILGILGMLVARLTGKVSLAWLTNRTYARMNFNAEAARRFLGSQMRDASTASVIISRQAVGEPLLSKVSWVDFNGNSRTIYQSGKRLLTADWSGTNTAVARVGEVLDEGLERFHAYYPNVKDPSKISFVLVLKKKVTTTSLTPAELSITCDVELKNP